MRAQIWWGALTTLVLCFQYEFQATQEMARAERATFAQGKGSHLKVFLGGKQSTLPMHGTKELGKGLEAAIKRQLGLTDKE